MRPYGFMPSGRFSVFMGQLRVILARSPAPVPFPAGFVSVTCQPTTETEVYMAIINLRDYYPFYTSDCFMEVSEEVAEMFKEFDRKEAAYRLRTYRHKAYYSLDRDDGLEHEAVFVSLSPHELYERKISMQELHAAISSLPDKQAKRIYAHFILGMTKKDIARAEGVDEKVVRVAIERGLKNLEKYLKKFL
jgi:RNA polymerase sigma-70 factor (ECF subfamily)